MYDVVGIGANSVDHVYRVPMAPATQGPGSKQRLLRHGISCGGQVATALATCRALGLTAKYIGAVGDDDNAGRVVHDLTVRGVDVSSVVRRSGGNQFAVVLIDNASGERALFWDRPEALCLTDAELPTEALQSARMVLVDDVDPRASVRAAELARAGTALVTTDLDHVTTHTEQIIRLATHPVLSEHLPAALTGEADLERALRRLRAWNAGPIVVTLGAEGAVALEGDELLRVAGFAVDAVDTTGSGDVFRGAFIAAVLRGWAMADVLRYANAAAAISCTREGALAGVPAAEEVDALFSILSVNLPGQRGSCQDRGRIHG